MKTNWVNVYWENCEECGSAVEAHTTCKEEGFFHDGDDVRCVKCNMKGNIDVMGETAHVNWYYPELEGG